MLRRSTCLALSTVMVGALFGLASAVVTAVPASATSAAQQAAILTATNNVRRAVAADESARLRETVTIPDLVWNADAAATAQTWADHLIATNTFDHNPNRLLPDGSQTGENIFGFLGNDPIPPILGSEAITNPDFGWASEAPNYDFDTNTCGAGLVCGHYTQLVWANTTSVGCGVGMLPLGTPHSDVFVNTAVVVCDYSPQGNFNGAPPYAPSATPPSTLGMVDASGNAYVKEGTLTSAWIKVTSSATAIAVASDTTTGPIIAVNTPTGVYAKKGTITGPWTHETAASVGANAIAIATDPTNGALIAINTPAGVYAKQGLTGAWTKETAANIGVTAIAVGSDATNGPLIAINTPTGVYAKQGTLTSPWTHLTAAAIGANAIAVSSDATNGPLISINTPAGVYAKQGTLTSPWTKETAANIGATAIAVATEAATGPLISINTPTGVYAKRGTLTSPWVHETSAAAQAISASG